MNHIYNPVAQIDNHHMCKLLVLLNSFKERTRNMLNELEDQLHDRVTQEVDLRDKKGLANLRERYEVEEDRWETEKSNLKTALERETKRTDELKRQVDDLQERANLLSELEKIGREYYVRLQEKHIDATNLTDAILAPKSTSSSAASARRMASLTAEDLAKVHETWKADNQYIKRFLQVLSSKPRLATFLRRALQQVDIWGIIPRTADGEPSPEEMTRTEAPYWDEVALAADYHHLAPTEARGTLPGSGSTQYFHPVAAAEDLAIPKWA